MDEISDFDLHAAWVRRAQADMKAFLEALATRLEQSLPMRVEIERKRDGLLSSHRHVSAIVVKTGSGRYGLNVLGADVRTTRQHEVRGVVVKTETLPLAEWLNGLQHELQQLSGMITNASQVLREFLTS